MKFRISAADSYPINHTKVTTPSLSTQEAEDRFFKTPSLSHEQYVELNTLEELLQFVKELGEPLIIDPDGYCITVYNDYME